jgi:hypothetical protein
VTVPIEDRHPDRPSVRSVNALKGLSLYCMPAG